MEAMWISLIRGKVLQKRRRIGEKTEFKGSREIQSISFFLSVYTIETLYRHNIELTYHYISHLTTYQILFLSYSYFNHFLIFLKSGSSFYKFAVIFLSALSY